MMEIPIAWLVTAFTCIAAIAVANAVRLPVATRIFLCIGFAGLGIIGLFLGLRLSYDSVWARVLQPFVALTPAPSIYLGIAAMTEDGPYPWRRIMLWHGVPLAAVLVAMIATNLWLADFLLSLVTLVYLGLLVRLVLLPGEAFVHVTPRGLRSVQAALIVAILFFLTILVGDLTILLTSFQSGPSAVPEMVSRAASVLTGLVFIAAAIGIPLILSRPETTAETTHRRAEATEEDRALLDRLDAMLNETGLYTDSELTLARTARRLSVPARALSAAVNRVTGTNMSRHINAFRVAHAQRLLSETDLPVTEVMLEAGFLSKSTFNTEFRRISGQTPSAFRTTA